MKLTILGATGSVGQELVKQALAAKHSATVLVRTPEKLGDLRSRLTVVQGDVADAAALARAIAGADVVLSALGHTKGSPNDVLTTAARNAIAAMRQSNVRRLVALTNQAVPDPADHPTGVQRFQGVLMGVIMGQINKDQAAEAGLITASGLDWTLVRATMLANGPQSGQYRVSALNGKAGSRIARADLADFMLSCAVNGKHLHEMPVISQ